MSDCRNYLLNGGPMAGARNGRPMEEEVSGIWTPGDLMRETGWELWWPGIVD